MTEAQEKGNLIKEALNIVDKLANLDADEFMQFIDNKNVDFDGLIELIEKANRLKRNRLWRLE